LAEKPKNARESILKTKVLGILTAKTTRRRTVDKDDRMTITVERGEETISFETCPDLHISEFRDLLMRLAAAVGYDQSNIEDYFIGKPDQDTQFVNEMTRKEFEKPHDSEAAGRCLID
jgi:hypothetical protein